MRNVIETLRRVAGAHSTEATDAELLERFIADRDEVAFEALVRRHGPMVLGVCRRILRHTQDAEDAFQATFLVLVRKATTVAPRSVVGTWLYSVARQTARKALAGNLRRSERERSVECLPEPGIVSPEPVGDLSALLDHELAALPETYRAAIVLCDLEGYTGRDAARQLGWPEGTLFTRLARGRKLLADRLARRGMGPLPALALPALPPALVTTTVQAASATVLGPAAVSAIVSPAVVTLTEGVLQAMIPLKLKFATVAGLLLLVAGIAVAGGYGLGPDTQPGSQPTQLAPPQNPAQATPDVRDLVVPLVDPRDSIWMDLNAIHKLNVNQLNVNQLATCTACHVDKNTSMLRALGIQVHNTNRTDLLFVQPAQDKQIEAGLRWLARHQEALRQQHLQKLAEQLDRETLLDLLRLVERRDATRHAIQSLDTALGKVREGEKDPRAEIETIDAVIKYLQERKEQLRKQADPKKP
jgi:RNA polymerase sigma factor (sigma-70 family)